MTTGVTKEVRKYTMTTLEFGEKLLSENLEKILLQEQDFNTIKDTLNNLLIGTIEPKTFKEVLVELRFKLLKELNDFFPFRCFNKFLKTFFSFLTGIWLYTFFL